MLFGPAVRRARRTQAWFLAGSYAQAPGWGWGRDVERKLTFDLLMVGVLFSLGGGGGVGIKVSCFNYVFLKEHSNHY